MIFAGDVHRNTKPQTAKFQHQYLKSRGRRDGEERYDWLASLEIQNLVWKGGRPPLPDSMSTMSSSNTDKTVAPLRRGADSIYSRDLVYKALQTAVERYPLA